MNCEKVRELASEYREGLLPASLERSVRDHVAACAGCSRELETLDSVWNDLDLMPVQEPPLFFHENVMTAVEGVSQKRASWRDMLPRLGRVALGTAAVAGAVAAMAWTLLLPSPTPMPSQQASLPLRGSVLPGETAAGATETPRLRIARSSAILGDGEAAVQFAFWLEDADRGAVRVHLLSDGTHMPQGSAVRFLLHGSVSQALVVPLSAMTGDTVDMHVFWTSAGRSRSRVLFVPVQRSDAVPAPRQSFGLPAGTLYGAAHDVAVRYGLPVTIENVRDIPEITVIAREQTAAEALRSALKHTDLEVSSTGGGLLVRHRAEITQP